MTTGDKMHIREFKLDSMVINPSIAMIAKRGSGKSWVVRAILHHFRTIPVGLIIAPTDKMNCFYGNFFPDTYIHYEYKSEIVERLLTRQTMIISKNQDRKKRHKATIDARSFIIMDDCLAQKGSWAKDPNIKELFFNGRHFEIMYILTMQFPLGIAPELRSNFDYIFLLADDFISNRKRLHDHYAGMFPTFDSFMQVFSQLTANFGSMVISNRGAGEGIQSKIFWYKAPNLENVKSQFGCKQFRDFHEKNYNSDWRKKQKGMDFEAYCINKKKSKSFINVEKEEIDDKGNIIDKRITSSKNNKKR